jgi:hypothetical protein
MERGWHESNEFLQLNASRVTAASRLSLQQVFQPESPRRTGQILRKGKA